MPRVLIVDPDVMTRALLRHAASAIAEVHGQPDFLGARARLFEESFDFVVTNLRLAAYNGLHLVYLVASYGIGARSIVYTDRRDVEFGRQVRDAGAFYETRERLPVTLTTYLRGALPARDRRDPAVPDRRVIFRGGRRSWDQHLVDASR